MDCKLCNIYLNKELFKLVKLYEDDICVALLSKKPASLCHVIIYPKKHYTILEQVPDIEVGHLFNISNIISRSIFESLNVQGTNILVQNGVAAGQEEPHFCIHVISRHENDGIKLEWKPQQLNEEQMSTIELQYKQFTGEMVFQKESNNTEIKKDQKDKQRIEKISDNNDDENYMLKYFNRIP
jgi:histidine triad (HIT) family protein